MSIAANYLDDTQILSIFGGIYTATHGHTPSGDQLSSCGHRQIYFGGEASYDQTTYANTVNNKRTDSSGNPQNSSYLLYHDDQWRFYTDTWYCEDSGNC